MNGMQLHTPARVMIEKNDTVAGFVLREAVMIDNRQNQIRVAERSLDIYRMILALERAPKKISKSKAIDLDVPASFDKPLSPNPIKFFISQPNIGQILYFLASSLKGLREKSCYLLYITADGQKMPGLSGGGLYLTLDYSGGLATAYSMDPRTAGANNHDEIASLNTLYANDLIPFLRKPFFVIVDSNNSSAFKDIRSPLGQPVVCLLSPEEYPLSVPDSSQIGSLFTLFLQCPYAAFSYLSGMTQVEPTVWVEVIDQITAIEKEIESLLLSDEKLGTL